jgi:hypothetical protein
MKEGYERDPVSEESSSATPLHGRQSKEEFGRVLELWPMKRFLTARSFLTRRYIGRELSTAIATDVNLREGEEDTT